MISAAQYTRSGVGDYDTPEGYDQQSIFNTVFGSISNQASSGADTIGQVSDWAIRIGLGAAALRQILNGVATSAAATPAIVNQAQNEMRYLDQYYQGQNQNSWIWPVVILAGAYLLTRHD